MWICPKCQNENEDNFKFCWSCGLTRQEIRAKPESKSPVTPPEIKSSKPSESSERESVKRASEPVNHRPAEDDEDVLPMFSRVSGVEHESTADDEDVSLERKIFIIAVRLVGLFFLYQVLVALPDLAVVIYTALSNAPPDAAADLLTGSFVIPAAKLLFYLVVGIYLIASGRILLWLLPGR